VDAKTLPPLETFSHRTDVQIRFNDIDILGHLNNTVYFSFFDTGKAWFFESIMNGSMNWKRVESVIANIDCAYVAPVFFGEEIEVLTRCMAVHEKSFRLQQVIVEKKTRQIKAASETVMVSFNPDTNMSQEIPAQWREALESSMTPKT
jgi:acyl-CoA thioester hydrolase